MVALSFYDIFKLLTSEWLFYRLGPVCLVVESFIVYKYYAHEKKYNSVEERKKSLKLYWKINAAKLGFMLCLIYLLMDESNRYLYNRMLNLMLLYYLFTLTIVVISLLPVRNNVKDNKKICPTRPEGNKNTDELKNDFR